MFAYETMNEGTLSLLRGITKAWFEKGFSAKGIGWTGGSLDIAVKDNCVEIEFSSPLDAEIVWCAEETVSFSDISRVQNILKSAMVIR